MDLDILNLGVSVKAIVDKAVKERSTVIKADLDNHLLAVMTALEKKISDQNDILKGWMVATEGKITSLGEKVDQISQRQGLADNLVKILAADLKTIKDSLANLEGQVGEGKNLDKEFQRRYHNLERQVSSSMGVISTVFAEPLDQGSLTGVFYYNVSK